jgi:predicted 2-oxoglutarate/Fe(II)-dependent dioxygenase YbiX
MIRHDTGYEILRYGVGTECREHVDSYTDRPRTLSCSIALNEEFEGGQFTFFDGRLRYTVPAGSAIVFPSNFMYTHAVAPITQGTRYSVITWLV